MWGYIGINIFVPSPRHMVSENSSNQRPNHAEKGMASNRRQIRTANHYLAMPHVAPSRPLYLPRLWKVRTLMHATREEKLTYSWRETISDMIIWTSWMMPPPPMPWTARHIISQVKLFAAPQRAEPNYDLVLADGGTIIGNLLRISRWWNREQAFFQ